MHCPYCRIRDRNSNDHVFPDFLGGRNTIQTCKWCNDYFGHSVEARASVDLAPVVILLRTAGLCAPKRVVWKRAFRDGEVVYDLDSNLEARTSTPVVVKDEAGNMKEAFYHDDRMVRKFVAAFKERGKNVTVTERPERKIPIPIFNFNLRRDRELQRLAMKMAVATAEYLNRSDLLDAGGRRFLLGEDTQLPRAMVDTSIYTAIENLRSAITHLAYVEGNAKSRSCYGVVQLYGLVQFRVVLSDGSYVGDDFACVGTLNPTAQYSEHFETIAPLRLAEPSKTQNYALGAKTWQEKFWDESRKAFGDKAFADFRMTDVTPKPLRPWSSSSSTAEFTTFLTTGPKDKK